MIVLSHNDQDDKENSENYTGISIAVGKIFVLVFWLKDWLSGRGANIEEQNVFRGGRRYVDQFLTLKKMREGEEKIVISLYRLVWMHE